MNPTLLFIMYILLLLKGWMSKMYVVTISIIQTSGV